MAAKGLLEEEQVLGRHLPPSLLEQRRYKCCVGPEWLIKEREDLKRGQGPGCPEDVSVTVRELQIRRKSLGRGESRQGEPRVPHRSISTKHLPSTGSCKMFPLSLCLSSNP